ncbi:MAG TPA: Hsp70 family protein [Pilimelia sp.]|nr:Hsp70 family protein [Pilimelia sp.]
MSAPDQPRLGIDFGTTHTVAALTGPDGRGQPILFDASFLLPSAVFAETDGRLLVGRDAERSARLDPTRFEPNPKRRIDDGAVLLGGRECQIPDVIGAVLRRVADEAARVAGALPPSIVLTYPANWAASRKAVLATAAQRAGMPPVTLVPEPIAAAVYFTGVLGHAVPPGAALVVYDFGGGTFDTSVLRRRPDGGWDVLASDGLPDIGGVDLDGAIVDHLRRTFGASDPERWRRLVEPTDEVSRRRHLMLRDDVRAAKEQLSRSSSASIHVPLFDTDAYLTRDEFERVARPYVEHTVDLTAATLQRAGVRPDRIAGLLLVGGSSRIPLVGTLLHHRLGVAPTVIEQPEVVVALGSLQALAPAPPAPGAAPWPGVPAPPLGHPAPPPPPPVPGPPVSGPPVSGPPVSGAPVSGSPVSGSPVSGPPVSGPPTPVSPPVGPVPVGAAVPPPAPLWPAPPGAPVGGLRRAPKAPRRRTLLLPALAAGLVLAVAIGGTVTWQALSKDSSNKNNGANLQNAGAGNPPGAPPPPPGTPATDAATNNPGGGPSVTVNKTVWYGGLKLTFGAVSHDAAEEQVVAKVLTENLGSEDVHQSSIEISLALGGQHYEGRPSDYTTKVPGGQKSDLEFHFKLPALDADWRIGTFYVGKGEEERAVVPIGVGDPVDFKPRLMFENKTVTHRDITVRFLRCELRADFVEDHKQVDKGHRAVACSIDIQTSASSHYVGADNFRIKLPDTTVIGPTAKPNQAVSGGEREADYLGFMIKWPKDPKMPGPYAMQVVDVHYGEKPTAATIHQFTINP